ncbi:serine hydrolase domain-containing protein [Streptomyces sp. NPDC054796]
MSGQLPVVHGTVAPGYEPVAQEFAAVAAAEPGHGAQLAAYEHGERVVDLWTGQDLEADSLLGVYSSTKGAAHLVLALLVREGTVELDREVAHYWPEFAAHGKDAITVRTLLAHRAGLVGDAEGLDPDQLADDRLMAARTAGQRPFWRPGSAFGYHALNIGALTGELVLRTTGKTMQEFYEARVRAPYGLDFWMGLPEEQEHRVLDIHPMYPTPEQQAQLDAAASGPDSLGGIAFNRHHPRNPPIDALVNSRLVRAAGPASYGGVASARGLARFYAAVIGEVDGAEPLLDSGTLAEFGQLHSTGTDLVSRQYKEFALGFQSYGASIPALGQGSIGHSGAAGSLGLADPRAGLALGYTRRRYGFPGGMGPDAARLARAVRLSRDARVREGVTD